MDCVELVIDDVGYRGMGFGRVDGKAVMVPRVALGERVAVQIVDRRKHYDIGTATEIIEASSARIKPLCSCYESCPGCTYLHVTYEEEVLYKTRQLDRFMKHFVPDDLQIQVLPAPERFGYRSKAVFHLDAAQGKYGYIGHDNKEVVDIPACKLLNEEINTSWQVFRSLLTQDAASCEPKRCTFRSSTKEGVLRWREGSPPPVKTISEKTYAGEILMPVEGFTQVNAAVSESLQRYVYECVDSIAPEEVCDLYCGSGLFALLLANRCGVKKVTGIERNKAAVACARLNAERLSVDARFYAADVSDLPKAITQSNRSERLWILDPPRSGLSAKMIQQILAVKPEHLIYISCAADTMARDVKRLRDQGYGVHSLTLLDMFPGTYAFESVMVMGRVP